MCTAPWAGRKLEAKKVVSFLNLRVLSSVAAAEEGQWVHPSGSSRHGHLLGGVLVFEGFMGPQGKLSVDPIYPIDSQTPWDREQILSEPETPAAISLPRLPCLLFIRAPRFSFMTPAINSPSGARERLLMCFR